MNPVRPTAPGTSQGADSDKIYRLSDAGRKLRAAPTPTLDEHHLRILYVIDGDTHVDVIRGWLRHYTNAQLDQWLHEIENDGLVTSRPAASGASITT